MYTAKVKANLMGIAAFSPGDMIICVPEYFEFTQGKSSKFWEIHQCSDTSITTSWGRIGSKGQSNTKHFNSKWECNDQMSKISYQKAYKGYDVKTRPIDRQKFDDKTKVFLILSIGHALAELLDQDGKKQTIADLMRTYQVISDE